MFRLKIEDTNMNSQPLKASAAKGVRAKLVQTYPNIADHIDEIWPKKAAVFTLKLKGEAHMNFIRIDEEICFMELRDRSIIPMLKVLHRYPIMMNQMQCDKGAIRHIFSGSNVMAPGLTSEGGIICEDLEVGAPVAIMAEGKKHAMGVGYLQMSSDDIKKSGKGVAIELIFYPNDSVWKDLR